ncbi:winged helix-turn-helix transcriptional regulator [Kribbella solani]|nr:winged helix-turn-helix transcriptional regulator [Kribbella solani]MDX3005217.1 winged helix-turn-helix transcriptional regulator [Kribbella solani]
MSVSRPDFPARCTRRWASVVRDGLLSREVLPSVPPSVRYDLTPLGADAVVPLTAMIKWVRTNAPTVLAAQQTTITPPAPAVRDHYPDHPPAPDHNPDHVATTLHARGQPLNRRVAP